MTVEVTAFGTNFAEGVELVENKPFTMLEGAPLVLHLFDNQEVRGRVLRTEATRALVELDEHRWWLERKSTGAVGRWVVRAREGVEHNGRLNDVH